MYYSRLVFHDVKISIENLKNKILKTFNLKKFNLIIK